MAAVASISSRSTGLAEQYGSSAVAKVIVPSGIDRVPIWEGQLVCTTRPQPWTLAALVLWWVAQEVLWYMYRVRTNKGNNLVPTWNRFGSGFDNVFVARPRFRVRRRHLGQWGAVRLCAQKILGISLYIHLLSSQAQSIIIAINIQLYAECVLRFVNILIRSKLA